VDSVLATFLILGTPAFAIVGGIVAGILKTRGQQRLIELAQRERIAAIERGLDLSQLTPLSVTTGPLLTSRQAMSRKAQGLMIGGILTLALGLGLSLTLLLMPSQDGRDAWPIGFVPFFMGIALMISARIVRGGLDQEPED
jgi:hypothetical protein